MYIKRKVVTGSNEIEDIFENAALAGVDVIECCTMRTRSSVKKIYGYETPRISVTTSAGTYTTDINNHADWFDGVTKFFPDANERAWGYVYDTPTNRERLTRSLAAGWFFIVDPRIRKEVEEKAKEMDLPTVHTDNMINVKKTVRERTAEEKADKLEAELKAMREKLALMETQQAVAKGQKTQYVNKRLASVKIPDREQAIKNIAESKNENIHSDYVA